MHVEIEKENCWNCNNWIYALVFWSIEIGEYIEKNYLGVCKYIKRRIMQVIRNKNGENYVSNEALPLLFCEDLNWQGRPFMSIFDFLNLLERDDPVEPDFRKPIIELAMRTYKFSDFNKLN